ncbi:MAG: HAD-IA family hydrolase, partial [Chloroflexota bacterium]
TLGIGDQFERIFDIKAVNFVSKPAPHPYKAVVHMLDTTADACIFIDDKVQNLKEPKKLGMRTVLVDAEPDQWVDATISHIHEIGDVIQNFIASE